MTSSAGSGPVKGHLEQLITRHSTETGVAADRVRRWVSTMVLLGALDRQRLAGDPQPRFLLKGGVAIELRIRAGARATKDVDVVFRGAPDALVHALDDAFAAPYGEFAFLRGAAAPHGPHARRFDVRLSYRSRAWSTVRLEVSGPEPGVDQFEWVPAIGLETFKLAGPAGVPCLPLRFQIAQKLHAVTERPADRENARFRDLVDLLLLRDLVVEAQDLRAACEATFEHRGTHGWPPTLEVPASWRAPYARLARDNGLAVTDVEDAAAEVRRLIAQIAAL